MDPTAVAFSSSANETAPSPNKAERFHGLDSVRAAAMLLGVLFHAIIMNGGMLGARGSGTTDWMHSFRMPLFFLISGFFCHMMLKKYRFWMYLVRRWWRIAVPMVLVVFAVALWHQYTTPMPAPPNNGLGAWLLGTGKNALSVRWFGSLAPYLTVGHLWFLWYLLIFATITPFFSVALSQLTKWKSLSLISRAESIIFRYHLIPVILGIISTSYLMKTMRIGGWNLGPANGVFARFPEGLWTWQNDWPFYFCYFVVGWWLFRRREDLIALGRQWLFHFALGVAFYAAAVFVSKKFAFQTELHDYRLIRLQGYMLYALGASFTAFGFLGFFQHFLNKPNKITRYFSDTAFWIYLVHLDLLQPIFRWIRPLKWEWWSQGILAAVLATIGSLILFEVFVRRTPLTYLFGPTPPKNKRPEKKIAAQTPAPELAMESTTP